MFAGRRALPHEPPSWIDPSGSVWFVTICCRDRTVNQLTINPTANHLLDSVKFRHDNNHWYAHIFLLMPDHCHALLSFPRERRVSETIRQWKRWTSAQLGIKWQMDFFDHRLRNDENFSEKYRYIAGNPVRAKLISQSDDWPYVWIPET